MRLIGDCMSGVGVPQGRLATGLRLSGSVFRLWLYLCGIVPRLEGDCPHPFSWGIDIVSDFTHADTPCFQGRPYASTQ